VGASPRGMLRPAGGGGRLHALAAAAIGSTSETKTPRSAPVEVSRSIGRSYHEAPAITNEACGPAGMHDNDLRMGQQVACSRCGDFVEASGALLSNDGEPVCQKCNDRADIDAGEERAAGAIFSASGGAIGLAVIAIFYNPCLIPTVMGVMSGAGTFALIARHPEYRKRLGWKLPVTMVVAALGIALSVLAPVISVLFRLGAR